jgi:chemotaxis protein MotB
MKNSATPSPPPAPKGAPRWMVTFADLMSLLFAMFVLLISFANFDEVRFAKGADSMRETFNGVPNNTSPNNSIIDLGAIQRASIELSAIQESSDRIDFLTNSLNEELQNEIAYEGVSINKTDDGVLIRLPNSMAFSSGGAKLSSNSFETLDKIKDLLMQGNDKIYISGHTDNVPILTEFFRSNWDLAAARAVSVAHFFHEWGNLKHRITVQSFSDTRPLVANETAKGRALNRRVEIFIKVVN